MRPQADERHVLALDPELDRGAESMLAAIVTSQWAARLLVTPA